MVDGHHPGAVRCFFFLRIGSRHTRTHLKKTNYTLILIRFAKTFTGKGWTGCAVDTRDEAWLKESILGLVQVARICKSKREAEGGLELQGSGEYKFSLDAAQQPTSVQGSNHLEVHETIAELMILANEAVARRLLKCMPDRALVRRHPPATQEKFKQVIEFIAKVGFFL